MKNHGIQKSFDLEKVWGPLSSENPVFDRKKVLVIYRVKLRKNVFVHIEFKKI